MELDVYTKRKGTKQLHLLNSDEVSGGMPGLDSEVVVFESSGQEKDKFIPINTR